MVKLGPDARRPAFGVSDKVIPKTACCYEDCSNMNAGRFITFFTYMLRQSVIPFWKELSVVFLRQIAMHVLVHVQI